MKIKWEGAVRQQTSAEAWLAQIKPSHQDTKANNKQHIIILILDPIVTGPQLCWNYRINALFGLLS